MTGLISGDGKAAIDEVGSPRFLLLTAACWNGIAMGAMDIARHHVTTKEHADVGMRIADYPTIQVSERINVPSTPQFFFFFPTKTKSPCLTNDKFEKINFASILVFLFFSEFSKIPKLSSFMVGKMGRVGL